ncbi:MAG: DotU family type IV/VI secretion system protein [Deltaproteobacteria bacterium]|nr:DotU family type IV/VI secretion system protein [Deltaproteobacteria bacterium]
MRFASRFFRIFRLVLEAAGDERRWPDWPSVTRELRSLLAEERNLPLPPGFGPAERREALWPVFAWIDETFLTSGRRDAAQWYDHSLQRSLLDTNRGGELFYRRLKALLALRHEHLPGGGEGSLSALRLEREMERGPVPGQAPPLPRDPFGLTGGGPQPPPAATSDYGMTDPADYLPEYFYLEEEPDGRAELITAADIEALWLSPGDGPEPLESVLDTYAMCLILGFKGQFSPRIRGQGASPPATLEGEGAGDGPVQAAELLGGPAGSAEAEPQDHSVRSQDSAEDREVLKAAARRQMHSWSSKGVKATAKRGRRGFFGWLADFWRDYDWVFYHIVIPLLAMAAFYFHGVAIIESLPF